MLTACNGVLARKLPTNLEIILALNFPTGKKQLANILVYKPSEITYYKNWKKLTRGVSTNEH